MNLRYGILRILSTKNNTHIVLTDLSGKNTMYQTSGGQFTKKGREKSSPYVGIQMISKIIEILKIHSLNGIYIYVRGRGGIKSERIYPVFSMILKFLKKNEINILEILKKTPIAHGGTRRKYGRRGRRV